MLETGAIVNALIETRIFVRVWDVDSLIWGGNVIENCGGKRFKKPYLACCGYIAGNATVDRKATFKRTESKISDQLFVFKALLLVVYLVLELPSSPVRSLASKSNTLEKLPLEP